MCLGESITCKPIDKSKLRTGRDFIGPMNYCHVMFMPEKLFLFELDDAYLDREIRVEVANDNNNYTNGFMTEFSHMRFHSIFLIPDCLMYLDNWYRLDRIHNASTSYNDKNPFPTMFNMDNGVVVKSTILTDPNDQNFKKKAILNHNIGGSFSIKFPLYTKHRIRHLGRPDVGKIRINRFPALLLSLFGALNTSA